MSQKIESLIQNLLTEKDSTLVADELMKIWEAESTTLQDQNAIVTFLAQAGFLSTLRNQLLEDLSKGKKVNWVGLLFFLSQEKLSAEKLDSIYVGLLETNEVDTLMNFKSLTKYPKYETLFQRNIEDLTKAKEKELSELKQKLKRFINDKNTSEVKKISEILYKRFSYDDEVRDLTSDLELAKARKILKKKEKDIFDTTQISPERSEEFKHMAKSYIEEAKKNKEQAYQLAVSLYQMEAYSTSLSVIELSPDSAAKDWLKIELLILNKKYIEALDFSFEIEKKYHSNPNTVFETLYYRAIALYELNQKDKAQNILQKILEVKPEHLKSQLKLSEWKGFS